MSSETGSRTGSTVTKRLLPPVSGMPKNCPVRVSALAERTSPISIDPESPMKSLAGWKLWGRNPAQTPASIALRRAPVVARVRSFSTDTE